MAEEQSAAETSQKKWYDANCHCGAVRYQVFVEELGKKPLNQCTCSICTKNGYVSLPVLRENIKWLQGYETLNKYRFKNGKLDHLFCPVCGSSLVIDFNGNWKEYFGGDALSVNVWIQSLMFVEPC